MTPFERWWNENAESLLLQYSIADEPQASPTIRDIKKRYAACWNAALDAVKAHQLEFSNEGCDLPFTLRVLRVSQ